MRLPLPLAARRGALFLLLLGAISCAPARALAQQDLPRERPERMGVSSERLKRINQMIQRHIDAKHISGAVTLVARQGKVVHFEAQGQKDVDSQAPMTVDTLFHMASCTKPVTGVAIMMLIEEGKIGLNEPVSKYIPEFKDTKVAIEKEGESEVELVAAERPITIRDLMTHTSGLASGGLGGRKVPTQSLFPRGEDTLKDVVGRLSSVPLDFQPGTRWRYSGLAGIDVLARVVEVASGQSFDEFLRERLFHPLHMTDTHFVVPDDKQDRRATIYRSTDQGLEKNPMQLRFPKTYFSGAGGLISTAADYFRFADMLRDRGSRDETNLLSPRAVELLSSNHVGELFDEQPSHPRGMGFGLTVAVVTDSAAAGTFRNDGSFGWDGAFGTRFWVDPKDELVAVLMVQTSVGPMIQREFDTAVMQSIVGEVEEDDDD